MKRARYRVPLIGILLLMVVFTAILVAVVAESLVILEIENFERARAEQSALDESNIITKDLKLGWDLVEKIHLELPVQTWRAGDLELLRDGLPPIVGDTVVRAGVRSDTVIAEVDSRGRRILLLASEPEFASRLERLAWEAAGNEGQVGVLEGENRDLILGRVAADGRLIWVELNFHFFEDGQEAPARILVWRQQSNPMALMRLSDSDTGALAPELIKSIISDIIENKSTSSEVSHRRVGNIRQISSISLSTQIQGISWYYFYLTHNIPDFQSIAKIRLGVFGVVALPALLIIIIFWPFVMTTRNAFRQIRLQILGMMDRDQRTAKHVSSRFREVDEVLVSVGLLNEELRASAMATQLSRVKLEKLVELGIEIMKLPRAEDVLRMILDGAKEISGSDGATLYTVAEDQSALRYDIIKTTSLNISIVADGEVRKIPDIPLINKETNEKNRKSVVTCSVLDGRTICVPDIYASDAYDFSGARNFDQRMNYRTRAILTVPLKSLGGQPIGALQLINPKDLVTGEEIGFTAEVTGFVEALASQAALTLDNKNLLAAQQKLLDAIVQMTAQAIDAKSPHTGGHCARVPVVAMMLAEVAEKTTTGSWADFTLTDDERRAFSYAAWLHDIGKLTTPEHVVEKATKLETIRNRIHEIRARFEVVKRDIEIKYLKSLMEGNASQEELERQRDEEISKINDDFAFIAHMNRGGENLDDAALQRIQSISDVTWVRTLDDRLGLSTQEEERLANIPSQTPAIERLIDDKPEHMIPHENPGLIERLRQRFKLPIPDMAYNLGEITNLSIRRGTLTSEDRYHINNHVIQTILMLESLPFPRSLQRVPEWAGGHHEKLNGKGYPSELNASQLSRQARILAVADIFEALTASDRPYKPGHPLGKAFQIMAFMVKDGELDPELFALFLNSGVWRNYAGLYLKPEQVDKIDTERVLTTALGRDYARTAALAPRMH